MEALGALFERTAPQLARVAAQLVRERHGSTLHRGRLQLGEQQLVRLDLLFVLLSPRKAAATHEVAQDAAVEARGELELDAAQRCSSASGSE